MIDSLKKNLKMRKSVFKMFGRNKLPGLDGIPAELYQTTDALLTILHIQYVDY